MLLSDTVQQKLRCRLGMANARTLLHLLFKLFALICPQSWATREFTAVDFVLQFFAHPDSIQQYPKRDNAAQLEKWTQNFLTLAESSTSLFALRHAIIRQHQPQEKRSHV